MTQGSGGPTPEEIEEFLKSGAPKAIVKKGLHAALLKLEEITGPEATANPGVDPKQVAELAEAIDKLTQLLGRPYIN